MEHRVPCHLVDQGKFTAITASLTPAFLSFVSPLRGKALLILCAFYLLLHKSKEYQTLKGAKHPKPVSPPSSFLCSLPPHLSLALHSETLLADCFVPSLFLREHSEVESQGAP